MSLYTAQLSEDPDWMYGIYNTLYEVGKSKPATHRMEFGPLDLETPRSQTFDRAQPSTNAHLPFPAARGSRRLPRQSTTESKNTSTTDESSIFDTTGSQSSACTVASTVPDPEDELQLPYYVYPCELHVYGMCSQWFTEDQRDDWILHLVNHHLGGDLPWQSGCWYCDEFFVARDIGETSRWAALLERMEHIANHILFDPVENLGGTEDLHLRDHLEDLRLLPAEFCRPRVTRSEHPRPRHMILGELSPHARRSWEKGNEKKLHRSSRARGRAASDDSRRRSLVR